MAQYSSYFRNNIRRELQLNTISSNVVISLNEYGTLTTNYYENGKLFLKAYSDAINRIYEPNIRVYINVPEGDYYFPGDINTDRYINLTSPQFSHIIILGAELNGTRPTANTLAGQNKSDNYDSLANYHRTRFHFNRNGFRIDGNTRFERIGFFGSWGGGPGALTNNDNISRRGINGCAKLLDCSIFGFDGSNASQSGGMFLYGTNSSIEAYNLTICNCSRGILTASGASFFSDFSSTDMIVNYTAEAIISYANSSVRLGDNANIKTTISNGSYDVYAYDSSSIIIRNPSVSGGSGSVARPDGSTIHTSASY